MSGYKNPTDYVSVSTACPKHERLNAPPMPSKKELLKRNSFGSVNDNPYLNKRFGRHEKP